MQLRRYPAKAVVGEIVPVSATVYREGHDAVGCNVVWRDPDGTEGPFTRMTAGAPGHRPLARRLRTRSRSARAASSSRRSATRT